MIMLHVDGSYSKSEMSNMFGTKSKEGLDRKLKRYGVSFAVTGRGERAVYHIRHLADPFKIYAITEMGCDANMDFRKLRNFYYYFFNDEDFRKLPDEMKEQRMREDGKDISRQTIKKYENRLVRMEYIIYLGGQDFVYYFAYKEKRQEATHEEYRKAWQEYWSNKAHMGYEQAIRLMIFNHGGIAKKQPRPTLNGIYSREIDDMLSLITESIENEISD